MTKNRLDYETLAGNLSSAETYKQLIEHLTLAIEDAQALSDFAAARNDLPKATAWTGFALNFRKATKIITGIAKDRAAVSTGFTQ